MGVEKAVRDELETLARRKPGIEGSAVAATALALAAELDSSRNRATAKSMCAKALIEALEKLHSAAPEAPAQSPLDEINARRSKRLARQAGAKT